ncbi:MAG: sigma-54-dependent Fis family transcriptional regulator [Leptospirales bacterium]|nr:sigma-54-dependent Fis family transcriptional regulator [Leptospirales bacterium]
MFATSVVATPMVTMPWIAKVLISHTLTATFTGVLLVSVLRQRQSPAARALAGLLGGSLLWILVNALSEVLTVQGRPSDFAGAFAGVALQVMVISAYCLSEMLGAKELSKAARIRIVCVTLGSTVTAALSFTSDYITARTVLPDGSTTADYRLWFRAAGAWSTLVTLTGLLVLYGRFSREKEARIRMQMRLYMTGILFSLGMTVLLAYLLPLFAGRSDLFFAGVDSSIIFAALMSYAILFHGMFDLRTAFLRLLLRVFLSVVLAAGIYFLFLNFLLDREQRFSIELLAGLSVFFAAIFVLAQWLLPVIDRLLISQTPPLEKLLRPLFALSADPLIEDDAGRVFRLLAAAPHFSKGWLLVPRAGGTRLHRNGLDTSLPRTHRIFLQRLLLVRKLPTAFLEKLDRVFLLDREVGGLPGGGAGKRFHKALVALGENGTKAFLPLTTAERLTGWLALGERPDDLPFYTRDLTFLESVRTALGVFFDYRRYLLEHQEKASAIEQDLTRLTEALSARTLESKRTELTDRSLVYRSPKMQETVEHALKLAGSERPVLITGETGTGKEVFARLLHERSTRAAGPFVAVNCAAVAENLWEDELFGHVRGAFTDARSERTGRIREAGNGILFLDEIGEMPLLVQARLLRLLQEGTFSPVGSDGSLEAKCRFVFATNRSLTDMIKRGAFREDLYYRINVLTLELPPLRERRQDIPVLAEYWVSELGKRGGTLQQIDDRAMRAMQNATWPGNIRELENFIVRMSLLSGSAVLTLEDLPREMRRTPPPGQLLTTDQKDSIEIDATLKEMIDDYTRRVLRAALKQTGGNRTQAAALLGMKRGSLLYRMKELNIE